MALMRACRWRPAKTNRGLLMARAPIAANPSRVGGVTARIAAPLLGNLASALQNCIPPGGA
jgi:hypothetical protein